MSSSALGQWERAFAVCNCVAQEDSVDGRIGTARLTKQSAVEISPQSEMVVWAQVQGGESLPHGSVLMEGVPEGTEWQVARTLACFKGDHPAWTLKGDNLSPQQQQQLEELIRRWISVIAKDEDDFGHTSAVLHQIPTGTAPPSRE
ncbi:hypothetical protein ABVT39_024944, partial [Epinephelus coioides]